MVKTKEKEFEESEEFKDFKNLAKTVCAVNVNGNPRVKGEK